MPTLRIKNENNEYIEVPALKGDTGPRGETGPAGKDYVITQADYNNIASVVETNIQPVLDKKIQPVHLIYDDSTNTIKLDGVVQNYNQIKALVQDSTNLVTVNYYDFIYRFVGTDGSAIGFTNSYIFEGMEYSGRIIINDHNEVKFSEIENVREVQINGETISKNGVANIPLLLTRGSGEYSIMSNEATSASGENSIALGVECIASNVDSCAMGSHNEVSGKYSFTHGIKNKVTANAATALGSEIIVSGEGSLGVGTLLGEHLETGTKQPIEISGKRSLGGGIGTRVSGNSSISWGQGTTVRGNFSQAFGNFVTSNGRAQFVNGTWNIIDENPVDTTHGSGARKYINIVGNGLDINNRSNAYTLDWDGNGWYQGGVTSQKGEITLGETTINEEKLKKVKEIISDEIYAKILDIPTDEHINQLIEHKLEEVENGSY